jgi:nucleoside diphosphate kinase
VYEGENAVRKIRDVLGPTDPTKAPGGTVRSEFGSNIMVNTAHASDSAENARREMGILKLHEGNFLPIVNKALAELKL